MVLNYIWIAFFLISFVIAIVRLGLYYFGYPQYGGLEIFPEIMKAAFDMAKSSVVDISFALIGVLTLWMGLMKIAEKSGMINILAKLIGPFFHKLFPDLPKDHPSVGLIMMNFSANMLGLDNAATPIGLKAMESMQELNPNKDTAFNPQIMFLVLNTSGLTLIPVSIMAFRYQAGAADPSDVFIPILIATFCSTLAGLITVAIYQKINLFDKVVMAYLGGLFAIIAGIIWYFTSLPQDRIGPVSSLVSNFILFLIIATFIFHGFKRKINVFEAFIEGAKEGFDVVVRIIPYLVGILVGIAVFRASGAMGYLESGLTYIVGLTGLDTSWVPALPTALMKPLSGSGARAMMLDAMANGKADSFAGRLACIFQGAADTTFFIVAVYFGSVGIKKTRYAIPAGLIADLFGVIAAIAVAYLFFPVK
ncbi:fused spore maturation proteins A and B [Sporocytophaga myxococcoides]|uniref:Fused spore maturation proteins A and B n=1 Tax=Sporocytophaga myxococcoides TaxID=153721 RepID=A0A098LGZ4_9BACT|nr:nucleoside recognition domain-containing protein [Sporocytophaga myxococcoides]GAL85398.1 fused spore maturation proteins A and B [Sporocytophaga myxococcoides]